MAGNNWIRRIQEMGWNFIQSLPPHERNVQDTQKDHPSQEESVVSGNDECTREETEYVNLGFLRIPRKMMEEQYDLIRERSRELAVEVLGKMEEGTGVTGCVFLDTLSCLNTEKVQKNLGEIETLRAEISKRDALLAEIHESVREYLPYTVKPVWVEKLEETYGLCAWSCLACGQSQTVVRPDDGICENCRLIVGGGRGE